MPTPSNCVEVWHGFTPSTANPKACRHLRVGRERNDWVCGLQQDRSHLGRSVTRLMRRMPDTHQSQTGLTVARPWIVGVGRPVGPYQVVMRPDITFVIVVSRGWMVIMTAYLVHPSVGLTGNKVLCPCDFAYRPLDVMPGLW